MTIASLIVELTTKLDGLTSGLAKGLGEVTSFASSVGSTLLSIGKYVGAGLAGGLAAVGYLILSTTTKVAALADEAARFSLPVSELQKFEYAASLAGVSAEGLTTALQFMLKNVADSATGAGAASDAFKKLGLSAGALKNLTTAQQFEKIGEAFNTVKNGSDRVNLAMQIFGRSGSQILNVFRDDLKKTSAEFDSLGLALTDSQAKAIKNFDDSRSKLSAIWEGFKEQVVAAVSPAFEAIYNYIIETIKRFGGIRAVAVDVGKAILDGMAAGIGGFIYLVSSVDSAILKFNQLYLTILETKQALKIYSEALKPGVKDLGLSPADPTQVFGGPRVPLNKPEDFISAADQKINDQKEIDKLKEINLELEASASKNELSATVKKALEIQNLLKQQSVALGTYKALGEASTGPTSTTPKGSPAPVSFASTSPAAANSASSTTPSNVVDNTVIKSATGSKKWEVGLSVEDAWKKWATDNDKLQAEIDETVGILAKWKAFGESNRESNIALDQNQFKPYTQSVGPNGEAMFTGTNNKVNAGILGGGEISNADRSLTLGAQADTTAPPQTLTIEVGSGGGDVIAQAILANAEFRISIGELILSSMEKNAQTVAQ